MTTLIMLFSALCFKLCQWGEIVHFIELWVKINSYVFYLFLNIQKENIALNQKYLPSLQDFQELKMFLRQHKFHKNHYIS